MATFNGFLDAIKRLIIGIGEGTWDDQTRWDSFTSWTMWGGIISSPVIPTHGGVDGQPLYYKTDIIDLGSIQDVYIELRYSAEGTIHPVIEYSETDSALTTNTVINAYTDDNTTTGTIQTHTALDYYEEGYCSVEWSGFRARYIRLTAFVDNYESADQRAIPILGSFNWEVKTDTVEEKLNSEAVSGNAHTLSFTRIGTITNITMTAHSETDKKLVPQLVSKQNATVRVVDANSYSVDGVSATVDVNAEGIPGVFAVDSTGIQVEAV